MRTYELDLRNPNFKTWNLELNCLAGTSREGEIFKAPPKANQILGQQIDLFIIKKWKKSNGPLFCSSVIEFRPLKCPISRT